MYKLSVKASKKNYNISIGQLPNQIDFDNYALVIVDDKIEFDALDNKKNVEKLTIDESVKNLSGVSRIFDSFIKYEINRKSSILFIGGGVVQDLGTLASALYMRGINWDYMPTTLMAMGDSCIGGKSSINFGTKKNLLGNFYPPSNILINTKFINSLTYTQVVSGLSEMIKILYASKPQLDDGVLKQFDLFNISQKDVDFELLIYKSLEAKKEIIEEDEFDMGRRRFLNYGHTYGHALESALNFKIPHGIAIAIGILAANNSFFARKTENSILLSDLLLRLLKPIQEFEYWKSGIDWNKFEESIALDKKADSKNFLFVLPGESSKLEFIAIEKTKGNLELIRKDLERALELITN